MSLFCGAFHPKLDPCPPGNILHDYMLWNFGYQLLDKERMSNLSVDVRPSPGAAGWMQ